MFNPVDSSFVDFGFVNNAAMNIQLDLKYISVVSDAKLHNDYFWVNKLTGIRFRS